MDGTHGLRWGPDVEGAHHPHEIPPAASRPRRPSSSAGTMPDEVVLLVSLSRHRFSRPARKFKRWQVRPAPARLPLKIDHTSPLHRFRFFSAGQKKSEWLEKSSTLRNPRSGPFPENFFFLAQRKIGARSALRRGKLGQRPPGVPAPPPVSPPLHRNRHGWISGRPKVAPVKEISGGGKNTKCFVPRKRNMVARWPPPGLGTFDPAHSHPSSNF